MASKGRHKQIGIGIKTNKEESDFMLWKSRKKQIVLLMSVILLFQFSFFVSPVQAGSNVQIVVSQAGYSSTAYKPAFVITDETLTDTAYQIYRGSTLVANGRLTKEGRYWGDKEVYTIDFTSYKPIGENYTIRYNGVSSYPFSIKENIWNDYTDEMTAFYRLLRTTDTRAAYPQGYSSIAPSDKIFHPESFLDDAKDKDTGINYDFTGGWFDAGDYGKYGGNQWVQANIAITYIRNFSSSNVQFDNDQNGIPDLLDEAKYGCEYLLKFAEQTQGAVYSIKNYTSFQHPEKATDNIPGTADDPFFILSQSTGKSEIQTGGSAKAAASMAACARAIKLALEENKIASNQRAQMELFLGKCQQAAVTFYQYALSHPNGTEGSYSSIGGIKNPMLLAEVELYLLTSEDSYKNAAIAKINKLTINDIRCTNYWDLRPLALAEFYPAADVAVQNKIKTLLKSEMDYFLSSSNDTPYGVVNEFGDFGVNEVQASYVADALRYYELFQDPKVLKAAQKGMYWFFGNNPWNISWVSGVGTKYVRYVHTRLDEESKNINNQGIVLPGALVAGANRKDPKNKVSESPWYEDRAFYNDDTNQWRHNEYSVSIEAGFFYAMFGLANLNQKTVGGENEEDIVITSPVIGDMVTGQVKVMATPKEARSTISYSDTRTASAYTEMEAQNGIYTAYVSTDTMGDNDNKKIFIKAYDETGTSHYTTTHLTKAPALPDPSHPLLYDGFHKEGSWGAQGLGWVNWYNQNGGRGSYAEVLVDGKTAGKFTQTSSATNSYAKFEPWHDTVDLTGYRYLSFTMKNPGYSNSRIKLELNDGAKTYQLSGGDLNVPSAWTTYTYDLAKVSGLTDKSKIHMQLWLSQTAVGYGEMLVDEITAYNQYTGTPPVILDPSVDKSTGTDASSYTFQAIYQDADNQKPYAMQLVIDGVVKTMVETDPGDVTYTDGKRYSCTTRLGAGAHSYYIRTTDTSSDMVKTEVLEGPAVSLAVLNFDTQKLKLLSISAGDSRGVIQDLTANGALLDKFNNNAANDYLVYQLFVPQAGTYDVSLVIRKSPDSGICQLSIDGINFANQWDAYAAVNSYQTLNLGTITFSSPGEKSVRFTTTGKNSNSKGFNLVTDTITLTRQE